MTAETEARSEDLEALASHLMLHQVEDERKQLDFLKRVFSFLKMSLFSLSNQDQQPNNLVLLDHFCQKLLLSILIFSVFKV